MGDDTPAKNAFHKRRPVHQKVAPGAELAEETNVALEVRKLDEIRELLWIPKGMSTPMADARLIQALEFYQEIAPRDGMEGMLAAQMIGTHAAGLECLRRAMLPDQTFAGRDMALKHAQKLMTLYTQQLAALNKHRGKGQQKVTVKYVNVEAGGQAIVGTVETGSKPAQVPKASAVPALEKAPEMPLPVGAKKKSKRKR